MHHYSPGLHTYALAGRTEDARTTLDEYRRISPDVTIAGRRRALRGSSSNGLYLAAWERLHDALRPLGMPEGDD